ncbi:MAG TPA: formate dehydrogenase subunit gamma [Beijerinckiaceae bacterium]|nr:formate dehydrogenase subunit gamma [Beijerinckiaceae bacterium]
MNRFAAVRAFLAALALVFVVGLVPAAAQTPPANNPTAQAVNEQQLLQQLQRLEGRVTIPNQNAALLIQPQGRDYRQFREGALPWIGGIVILGMILALAIFYLTRGRIAMEADAQVSGRKILRFNAFERFTHWLTAVSFIVLALTGLNYIFGKRLILPLIGPDAFAAWTQWAKFAHNFVSWPFMFGLLIMLVVWVRDNIPDRYDWPWIKSAGGFLSRRHIPARRFNAGQKLIFWSVILGGIALSVTGIILMFPIARVDLNGIQWSQYIHATVGVILIAIMIAHIYIGSLGMEGAYDAMGSGEVDLAWAKAHHSVWVDEQQAKTASGPQTGAKPAAAT